MFYPASLPFGDEQKKKSMKSQQFHCQYSAVECEETNCSSQCAGNVTVLVIRAFKLPALPKHFQTLCERGEILTALSPLIVTTWEKKNVKTDLHDIDSEKHSTSYNFVDRFFVFLHPPLRLP